MGAVVSAPLVLGDVMQYADALNYIFSLKTVSLNPSLERTTSALALLGNPQNSLKVIHIAGTNGKGSVAAMTAEILKAAGLKVGLFISPFIIDFCERIQVDGEFIPKSALCKFTKQVMSVQTVLKEKGLELGQFEFITVLAFLYFKNMNCDYVVLETGLGGRYDATNTVSKPLCTVITKISLDHTAILGDTIEKIAKEKVGIIKEGIPVVTCEQPQGAMKLIKETSLNLNASLLVTNLKNAEQIKINVNSTEFLFKGEHYKTSLLGRHQVENAILAITAVRTVLPNIAYNSLKRGLANVQHPARLELISNAPPIIIDGAHNPDGAITLADYLREAKFCGTLIFGGMKDKNISEVAKTLSNSAQKIITVAVQNNPRAETAENMKSIFSQFHNNVVAAKSYTQALSILENQPTVICGSLYLAADMRKLICKNH